MIDDRVRRFASKVVELQEQWRTEEARRVDEGLMREVARDLGLGEDDLVRIQDESRQKKERARVLRAAGSLDTAITELEDASALNPLDVEITYLLADALFARAVRTKDAATWERARDLCLQVIAAAPAHADAPALLNAIRNKDPARQRGGTAVLLAAIAVLLALAGLVWALM